MACVGGVQIATSVVAIASGRGDVEDPAEHRPGRGAPETTDVADDLPARFNAIYGIFGFGTPVGLLGLEAVHRFDHLELTAGGGLGLHGPQWAVMPRLKLGDGHGALTLGAGFSGGQYGPINWECQNAAACQTPGAYALWANFEIGGEYWDGGLAFRCFLGLGLGYYVGSGFPTTERAVLALPYLGLGVGHSF